MASTVNSILRFKLLNLNCYCGKCYCFEFKFFFTEELFNAVTKFGLFIVQIHVTIHIILGISNVHLIVIDIRLKNN